jgi:hypothetical protein
MNSFETGAYSAEPRPVVKYICTFSKVMVALNSIFNIYIYISSTTVVQENLDNIDVGVGITQTDHPTAQVKLTYRQIQDIHE